jgi:hypothetical protein
MLIPLFNCFTFSIFLQQAQSFSYQAGELINGFGLTDGLNALSLRDNLIKGSAQALESNIIFFQLGINGKDQISKQTIVFKPGMLARTNSILGTAKASMNRLLSFQQVIQQGVSVRSYVPLNSVLPEIYIEQTDLLGDLDRVVPKQVKGGFKMAS